MVAKQKSELRENAEVQRIHVGTGVKTRILCSECRAEVDIVENDNPNDSLVEKILSKSVPDRDKDTYVCRNGHDEGLEVE